MHKTILAASVGLLVFNGCIFFPNLTSPNSPVALRDVAAGRLSDFASLLDAPRGAFATVQIVNPTAFDATCRVTMRQFGQRVNLASRRVAAGAESVVIGPDRSDSILIEATFAGDQPVSIQPRQFRLGREFNAGDVIRFVLVFPFTPDDSGQDAPNVPVAPQPSAEISIRQTSTAQKVNPGTPVTFAVETLHAPADAEIDVFADDDPNNPGGVTSIADRVPAASSVDVRWDTSDLPPGDYTVLADLFSGAARIARSRAPQPVRINALPMLAITAPHDQQLVSKGRRLVIAWAGIDDDDDAAITIFIDSDTALNGNERILAEGIREDDVLNRDLEAGTRDLEPGNYFVGGIIDDGLARVVVYGPAICISDRLAGQLGGALLAHRMTTIVGRPFDPNSAGDPNAPFDPNQGLFNLSLGHAVDSSRDINGDGAADILVSDPLAVRSFGEGERFMPGAVFYHGQVPGPWPQTLSTDEFRLRIVGEQDGALTGSGVALTGPLTSDPFDRGEILIGAPQFTEFKVDSTGLGYVVDGSVVNDPNRVLQLGFAPRVEIGRIRPEFGQLEQLGTRVAATSDLNGDGLADLALAAPAFDADRGRVALVLADGESLPFGSIDQLRGELLIGEAAADRAGAAVARIDDFLSPQLRGLQPHGVLIGAPGANDSAGRVYLIIGALESDGQFPTVITPLSDVGAARPGYVLLGENPGDAAGTALAAVDANGDGKSDLLIGAPGYDNSRGRVYLVYNFADLPISGPINLADVGTTISGAVFDGVVAGDLFGWSVADAGDTDADGMRDMLIGAPGVDNQRGAAYLLYGGQTFDGIVPLADLGTCLLQGWELDGEAPGARLGYALSGGGDVNGNGSSDVLIGAPGNRSEGNVDGEALLIFGRDVRGTVPRPAIGPN